MTPNETHLLPLPLPLPLPLFSPLFTSKITCRRGVVLALVFLEGFIFRVVSESSKKSICFAGLLGIAMEMRLAEGRTRDEKFGRALATLATLLCLGDQEVDAPSAFGAKAFESGLGIVLNKSGCSTNCAVMRMMVNNLDTKMRMNDWNEIEIHLGRVRQ